MAVFSGQGQTSESVSTQKAAHAYSSGQRDSSKLDTGVRQKSHLTGSKDFACNLPGLRLESAPLLAQSHFAEAKIAFASSFAVGMPV